MTASQAKKYWRRWSAVCRANHWRWLKGRLVPEAASEISPHHVLVWNVARARAVQQHRGVIADDLRHACHILALRGRDKSHGDLTNAEFNRLLCLWGDERQMAGLLMEPDCLASAINFDHPENQTTEQVAWWIGNRCSPDYVRAVCHEMFGTPDFRGLDPKQLRGLHDLLKHRPNALVAASRESADSTNPDWSVA
jgi:hypothetical protein